MRSGSAMIAPTRLRGFSDAYGSWNTICSSRRTGRSLRRDSREMSRPSNVIEPSVRSYSRAMHRASVDLPQPGLADQAERLPGAQLEADVVDRVHPRHLALQDPLPDREVLLDVVRPEQDVAIPGRAHGASPVAARSCGAASSGWMVVSRSRFFWAGSRRQASR